MGRLRIPAVHLRGGTSKGVFFLGRDLPTDPFIRDQIFLRSLGSPDPYRRQIDGVGGAISSASKVAVISRSNRCDCDVDYLFGQVAIDQPMVDYTGNCGNLSSAVGSFAIEEGFVTPTDPVTPVIIWQVNTKKKIIAHVPTRNGLPIEEGNYEMDGVPVSGAEIRVEFLHPGGSIGKELLPTGNVMDQLLIPGLGKIEVTLLDAANPITFVAAKDLGLKGTELQPRVDNDSELMDRIEQIRAHSAAAMGLAPSVGSATRNRPGTPKIAFVGLAQSYASKKGETVQQSEIDLVARMVSMGRMHHAFAVTGAVATAIAALIPGSLVQRVTKFPVEEHEVKIGHPAGRIKVGASVSRRDGKWVADKAVVGRTARRLMEGHICLPSSIGEDRNGKEMVDMGTSFAS